MQIFIPRTDLVKSMLFSCVLFVVFFQVPRWTSITPTESFPPSEPEIVFHCTDWVTDTLPSYDLDFALNNPKTIGNPDMLASPQASSQFPQTIPNADWSIKDGAEPCNLEIKNLTTDSIRNLGFLYASVKGGADICQMSLTWRDSVVYSSCQEMQNGEIYARIYRRWSAICQGIKKDTVQVIAFERPHLQNFRFNGDGRDIFDRVATYEACAPDKSLIKKEDVTPFVPSFLYPRNIFIEQIGGKYAVQIKDKEFPICGGKGVKIARELYVLDSCSGVYIDTFQILIQVGAFNGPSIIVSTTIPELNLDSLNCSASFFATVEGLKSTFGVEVTGCHLGNVSLSIKTKKESGDEWPTVNYPVKNKRVTGLPPGLHRVFVNAFDGCFGANQDSFDFVVKDKAGPKPICVNGLPITLQPDGQGWGKYTLQATDLIAAGIYDCYGQGPDTNSNGQQLITHYSINRLGEKVDSSQKSIELNCDQAGKVVLVELHAWDIRGKQDYCITYAEVMNKDPRTCTVITEPLTIGGTISTEGNYNIQGVMVSISGSLSQTFTTNTNGSYSFIIFQSGGEYTITPKLDKNPLNGVSTFDLLLIQKHILGIQALNSPYKMIAADVNNSKSITTLDLIQLRKLILGLDLQFLNNTSWRFVDAAYIFPNPTNPWAGKFPEEVYINKTTSRNGNFVAIKIGDINASAKVNALEYKD
ncbi:MAG: dockerin type I domain-containing protein [Haliscomenobacter sp.]|uniref:dockerin type I domain-containing protein n=1 Tax=Haliscomenobacter sp. TaxID=2717303 RepID=UPI0029B7CDCC|nr:dockerin type I domain-containing protein [Haliscomenobacter sp.]MDX2069237.1 dockerin type I domain-containing protein [Haliscomenobacter sp.]